MPFSIVCVAPGASEAQVIELAKLLRFPGYSCISCYVHFGTGKKVKAAADPKQLAITQFFQKQRQ